MRWFLLDLQAFLSLGKRGYSNGCVLIFRIIGLSVARSDCSSVMPASGEMLIFLQIKLSESSVKFSMLCPSVVSLYTFLGRSLVMFHSLLT